MFEHKRDLFYWAFWATVRWIYYRVCLFSEITVFLELLELHIFIKRCNKMKYKHSYVAECICNAALIHSALVGNIIIEVTSSVNSNAYLRSYQLAWRATIKTKVEQSSYFQLLPLSQNLTWSLKLRQSFSNCCCEVKLQIFLFEVCLEGDWDAAFDFAWLLRSAIAWSQLKK